MKLNRRQFLVGAPAAGALLILPVGAALPAFVDDDPARTAEVVQLVLDFRKAQRIEKTLTEDKSPVVIIMPPGNGFFTACLAQDEVGGRTVTAWPKDMLWSGGEAPIIKDQPNERRLVNFWFDGRKYYAETMVFSWMNQRPSPESS